MVVLLSLELVAVAVAFASVVGTNAWWISIRLQTLFLKSNLI